MRAVLLALAMACLLGCGNSYDLEAVYIPSTDYTVYYGHIYCPSAKPVYEKYVDRIGWAEVCEWDCAYITHPLSLIEGPARARIYYWLELNSPNTWHTKSGCGEWE